MKNKDIDYRALFNNMAISMQDYMLIMMTENNKWLCIVRKPIQLNKAGDTLENGTYTMGTDNVNLLDFETQAPILLHNKPITLVDVYDGLLEFSDLTKAQKKNITDFAYQFDEDDEIETRQKLPKINTYGLMNDKANSTMLLDASLLDTRPDGQISFQWAVDQSGSKEKVLSYVSLTYEGSDIKLNKPMTAYDSAVYNALSTMFYYWKKENPKESFRFTANEVWRTMNGKKDSFSPSSAQLEKVVKSLDKMRFTRFTLDIKEELKAKYLTLDDKRVVDGYIETYLLKADKAVFRTEKNNVIEGYKVDDEPILYTYNRAKNHILWVDYELLDTSDSRKRGEYTIEFTNYLLQRIVSYQNKQLTSNRILFETLYSATGIEEPAKRVKAENFASDSNYKAGIRKTAQKDRETVEAIFTSWMNKKKLIKGYTPVKKGNAVIGYDLDILPAPKKALKG